MDASPVTSTRTRQFNHWLAPGRMNAVLAMLARSAKRPPLWTPLALLVVATLILRSTNVDLGIASLFYDPVSQSWPYWKAQPWYAIYQWGVLPGILLGVGGTVVYVLSFRMDRLKKHRRSALFLALALILGPGLLVNGLMKPGWGRPRPCQVIEFGGDANHLPPFEIGHYHRSSSFPSGHASIGFALIAPAFLAFRRYRYLAAAWFAAGISWGAVMGLTRIVQGRHFLSDVIWSAAVVYFTCWGVGALLRIYDAPQTAVQPENFAGEDGHPDVLRLPEQDSRSDAADKENRGRRAA